MTKIYMFTEKDIQVDLDHYGDNLEYIKVEDCEQLPDDAIMVTREQIEHLMQLSMDVVYAVETGTRKQMEHAHEERCRVMDELFGSQK